MAALTSWNEEPADIFEDKVDVDILVIIDVSENMGSKSRTNTGSV